MDRSKIVQLRTRRSPETEEAVKRIHVTMRRWGISLTEVAVHLGVSRQYLWQMFQARTYVSEAKLDAIRSVVAGLVAQEEERQTLGSYLRAARISAGFTLREAAKEIGYTYAAIERWEKDRCIPKPGVLWHLVNVYSAHEPAGKAVVTSRSSRQLPPALLQILR